MDNSSQPRPWQQVDSRVVFEHPIVTLIEDTVILPTGQQTRWLRLKGGRDIVSIICVDDSYRVLIARQYCHPPRRVVEEFPGGSAVENESYVEAARRELMEEVGLHPHQIEEIGAFLISNRRSDTRCRVFLATDLVERTLVPDREEFIQYEWLSIEEIEEKIRSGEFENGFLLAAWSIFRSRYTSPSGWQSRPTQKSSNKQKNVESVNSVNPCSCRTERLR